MIRFICHDTQHPDGRIRLHGGDHDDKVVAVRREDRDQAAGVLDVCSREGVRGVGLVINHLYVGQGFAELVEGLAVVVDADAGSSCGKQLRRDGFALDSGH